MGFCLFNNVAIAARACARPARRRARADPRLGRAPRQRHATTSSTTTDGCSTSRCTSLRSIPGTGALTDNGTGAGEGHTRERPDARRARARRVGRRGAARDRADRARLRPDLLLVSSGFDAHRDDPLAEMHADTRSLRGDDRDRARARRRSCRRAARLRARGRLRPRRAGAVGGRDDRGGARRAPRPSRSIRAHRPSAPAATTRAGGRRWTTDLRSSACGQKEGRRASTAPLPPASKAPQRLALPPGSLVCNGRRKGDRRGAVVAMREAMALHAVRPEAMKLPPAPAGLTRPDALGREWPVIDGAPALNAHARRPGEVSAATLGPREACALRCL